MCGAMYFLNPLHAQVSVYLCGGQGNVAQQLLYAAQIRPSLDEMRGERMPHRMG